MVATVAGFLSLILPWWNLVLLIDLKPVSVFSLFLFGAFQTGFLRAGLLFEWWSYLTLAVVVCGSLAGVFAYKSLREGESRSVKLIAVQIVAMVSGCVIYVVSLALTLATHVEMQDEWMSAGIEGFGPLMLHTRSVVWFFIHNLDHQVITIDFVSIGFFLSVVSSILSAITLYRLRRKTDYRRARESKVI